jgi:ATP-dependent Lon protease
MDPSAIAWMFRWTSLGYCSFVRVCHLDKANVSESHIFTPANVLDTIPAPLLDRMEVLEVSGYVSEEKIAIAERYLSPQAKEASGLKDTDISLEPEAIAALIRYYCRESGVRNLKKHIDKVFQLRHLCVPSV